MMSISIGGRCEKLMLIRPDEYSAGIERGKHDRSYNGCQNDEPHRHILPFAAAARPGVRFAAHGGSIRMPPTRDLSTTDARRASGRVLVFIVAYEAEKH